MKWDYLTIWEWPNDCSPELKITVCEWISIIAAWDATKILSYLLLHLDHSGRFSCVMKQMWKLLDYIIWNIAFPWTKIRFIGLLDALANRSLFHLLFRFFATWWEWVIFKYLICNFLPDLRVSVVFYKHDKSRQSGLTAGIIKWEG